MTIADHHLHPLARPVMVGDVALWSDQAAAGGLWATIDELTAEFGATHSEARIIGVAIGALCDLRGSATVDALPELISRLVRVRLAGPESDDRPPRDDSATPLERWPHP